MADGIDVVYGSDGLRTAASGLNSSKTASDTATTRLQGARLDAGAPENRFGARHVVLDHGRRRAGPSVRAR